MRLVVVFLALVALAAPDVLAGRLGKKKKNKKHHTSSTSTSTSTTTTTTEDPPTTTDAYLEDAEKVLYLDNMDIIKIHLPLPVKHQYNYSTTSAPPLSPDTPPNPLPTATVPSNLPTAPYITDQHGDDEDDEEEPITTEVPEVPEDDGKNADVSTDDAAGHTTDDASQDVDQVVIPDVATFDAVFANRSRLPDDVRVFTFGGVYEIIVNRTRNSVEVVMVRHKRAESDEISPLTEEPDSSDVTPDRDHLEMMVRGPSTTGLQREGDEVNEEINEVKDRKDDEKVDDTSSGRKDDNKPGTDESDKSRSDNRHSKDQARDEFDAIFINGSALGGMGIGLFSFNTSGTFMMNVSVSEDFMTVIISQVSQQIKKNGVDMPQGLSPFVWPNAPQRPSDPQKLRNSAPSDDTDTADSAVWPVMVVGVVGAVGTLLGAIVIWRGRARARGNTFVRRGEDYGSVEPAADAADFCSRSQYEALQ